MKKSFLLFCAIFVLEFSFGQQAVKDETMIAPSPDAKTATGIHNGDIGLRLWGPNNRLTFSIGKSDVWDRRWFEKAPTATLDDIKNWSKLDNFSEMFEDGNYYKAYTAYDFPCPKPVGQLIIGLPGDAAKWAVEVQKDTIPGVLTIKATQGEQCLKMRVYIHATRNLIVFEGDAQKPIEGLWLRLYRHHDTSVLGKAHLGELSKRVCETYDYTKDKGNGPIEPPTSDHKKGLGWITQIFPVEPTFPEGFRYSFAALTSLKGVKVEIAQGQQDLGTPAYSPIGPWSVSNYYVPDYLPINKAKGAAVTYHFPRVEGHFQTLVTVVTSTDTTATFSLARSHLQEALSESTSARFNDHLEGTKNPYYPFLTREPGGYYGAIPEATWNWATTSLSPSFWTDFYCATDETPWHGDFHFTPNSSRIFISNRIGILEPYFQLIERMLPSAQKNAREAYDCPGAMYPLTGYPIRSDKIINCTLPWEQIMEITAMSAKAFWEHYLYTADKEFLRNRSYQLLREGARFYAAYVTLEEDGYYHVFPTVSPEHWGLTKNLERNKDSQSALTLIKYHLKAAAQAAEILDVDKEERKKWKHIASKMAPYPTYDTPEGPIFVDVLGAPPIEYNWPVPLAAIFWGDDITLESPPEVLAVARRTIKNIQARYTSNFSRCLLGEYPEDSDIRTESLLQSRGGWDMVKKRGGWIRVFPAVPENYTGSFKNYLAIGAFEVSATSKDGRVTELTIHSCVGNTCQLVNPWPGKDILVREVGNIEKGIRFQGSHNVFDTSPNTTYQIEPAID